jgi:hypothetical protein
MSSWHRMLLEKLIIAQQVKRPGFLIKFKVSYVLFDHSPLTFIQTPSTQD